MRIRHLIYILYIIAACSVVAETFHAVKDGAPRGYSLQTAPGRWRHSDDGSLVGAGWGHLLAFDLKFSADGLIVEAEIALEKSEGSAASLFIGNMNLILDGAQGKPFFFERFGDDGEPNYAFLLKTQYRFTPNKFFRIRVESANGKLMASADGQTLGEIPFTPSESLLVALRPHRNTMHVKSFSVTGTPVAGVDMKTVDLLTHKFTTLPVSLGLMPCNNENIVYPKSINLGKYSSLSLAPCDVTEKATEFHVFSNTGFDTLLPESVSKAVYDASKVPFNVRPALLKPVVKDAAPSTQRMLLWNPDAPRDYPHGEVRCSAGHPEFWVEGVPVGTVSGRLDRGYGPKIRGRAIQEFAAAGIHDHLLIVFPYHFMKVVGKELVIDWDSFLRDLTDDFGRIIAEDPLARFHLHYELLVSSDWADAFPDEAIKLDNGAKNLSYGPGGRLQPSYASPTWRRQAGAILSEAVKRLRNTPYADRITHWRLLYANCGEWNHWGYAQGAFVDFSTPMQHAFGEWLKRKYNTEAALQSAWGRTDATFDSTNLVPDKASRLSGGKVFRTGGKEVQSTVDYYAFFQEYTVRTIEHFARIVKEASDGRLLVGAYYGYYWGHMAAGQLHQQDSGSYGIKYMLESPWLDFVGGPYPYENRRDGQELNGLALSLARHGKIWESEGDMRTHYSGEANRRYGTTDNATEDVAISRRDWLLNRSRHATYYFFDFVNDWYRDKELLDDLALQRKLDSAIRGIPDRHPSQIAMIVSEEAIPHLSNNVTTVASHFREFKRCSDRAWGAPFDILGEADLKDTDFSLYKLVIFGNAFYASDETIRLAHERVMKDGRTVLFLHAPALIGDDNAIHPERSRSLTGIGLKAEPEATFTEVHGQQSISSFMKTGPVEFKTIIDDSEATVIATYPDGAPAGARKKLSDCTSIILCHHAPNAAFMRSLLKQLGIHVYEQSNTYNHYFFTGPLAAIYSRGKSKTILAFQETYEIIGNPFTGEIIAKNANSVEIETPEHPTTTVLFTGTADEWERIRNEELGISN